ncbi:MAG TPA: glycosyltransferase family 4 protein [Planctomycetaceae bacterium]|nr:glycosyltransferase family 4 protein [Planctomycetaceae bacterium]
MTLRVGFLTTHPIQYQVPVFRHLAQMPGLDFTVFYCQIPDAAMQGAEFNVPFQWDLPLLDGYESRVLKNISRQPGVMTFSGCDTPEIDDILRNGPFDAFVINGWHVKSGLQGLWACRRHGVPCLVRGEANDLRKRAWWKKRLQAWLVRQYAGCLAIGRENAAFYRARGVPADRVFSSPYCVENERFAAAADPERRRLARKRWNVADHEVCFLFSGKLIDKKHPRELIIAFREAIVGATARLLMVGDGPLRQDCEAMAQQHQLPVTFTGFLNQTEILDAYAAADALVLPSDAGETWGLVVNEAMAAGKPAIVSNRAGCAGDLILPDETGCVFPYPDWTALADTLRRWSADRAQLLRMGERAREHIRAYTPRVAADGIWDAVRTVARRRSPARSV